jgi:hypothetical protein
MSNTVRYSQIIVVVGLFFGIGIACFHAHAMDDKSAQQPVENNDPCCLWDENPRATLWDDVLIPSSKEEQPSNTPQEHIDPVTPKIVLSPPECNQTPQLSFVLLPSRRPSFPTGRHFVELARRRPDENCMLRCLKQCGKLVRVGLKCCLAPFKYLDVGRPFSDE